MATQNEERDRLKVVNAQLLAALQEFTRISESTTTCTYGMHGKYEFQRREFLDLVQIVNAAIRAAEE